MIWRAGDRQTRVDVCPARSGSGEPVGYRATIWRADNRFATLGVDGSSEPAQTLGDASGTAQRRHDRESSCGIGGEIDGTPSRRGTQHTRGSGSSSSLAVAVARPTAATLACSDGDRTIPPPAASAMAASGGSTSEQFDGARRPSLAGVTRRISVSGRTDPSNVASAGILQRPSRSSMWSLDAVAFRQTPLRALQDIGRWTCFPTTRHYHLVVQP